MLTRLLATAVLAGALAVAPAHAEPGPVDPSPTEPTASTPTPAPPQVITMRERPRVVGTTRYGRTVKRTLGRYSVAGATYRTRWLRDGEPIRGATRASYRIQPRDVGHRIAVRVSVRKAGHRSIIRWSPSRRVKHLRDVRHTVRYTIATKGRITTSTATFRRQVQQTLDDPRGWRAAGIAFKRVRSGGSMTIVLSEAGSVPTYSSACSTRWSCRVGRHVVINQDRWKHASPAWKSARGTTLRGYRNMVVNHEVGHWLGWHHASCGGKGRKAPIMMQQSKGANGCAFNPWPKAFERRVPRYR